MQRACPRCCGSRHSRNVVTAGAGAKVKHSGKPPARQKHSKGCDSGPSAAAQLAARLERDARGVTTDDVARAALQPAPVDDLWRLWRVARDAETAECELLDAKTCSAVLAACSRSSGWDARKRVDAVWQYASQGGQPDAFVVSAYVAALGRAGDCDGAFAAIGGSVTRELDTVTWNALLQACNNTGNFTRGLDTFADGVAAGLAPDVATHTCRVQLLTAAGDAAAGAQACESAMLLCSPSSSRLGQLLTAGIAAAGRAGDAARAWRLYTRFCTGEATADEGEALSVAAPDAALFTALIDAAGSDADAAWKAFQEADARGIKLAGHEPAVCAMLVAFARARAPERAWLFFESIRRAWPLRRPPRVCYLLLRDCAAVSNDTAMAARVAALMLSELRTSSSASHSTDGQPSSATQETQHVRPGAAVARFTVAGITHETRNGEAETALPDDTPAKRLLSGAGAALVAALGEAYRPDTSCVQLMAGGKDAQVRALCSHAEKKALGALLLRLQAETGERAPLVIPRVWVSIRMCRDCHAAFSLASQVFGTRVECLDGHTHVFVDGICSCGNRWR